MELLNDAIIVSVDFTRGRDVGVLVVGRKLFGEEAQIINAFQGEEAYELYHKLVTKNKEVMGDEPSNGRIIQELV